MYIGIIPARFQSTRFPGKLLAKAGGKTILQRTFESALCCKALDALYVATDDERIAEHARSIGGEVLWTPSSCQNGTERITEAYRSYSPLQKAELIVNIQGDHPCTTPETIEAMIQLLQKDKEASLATAATPLKSREEYLSSHVVKCVFDQNQNALYFSRSPIPYAHSREDFKAYGHIGIYCYRAPFLLRLQELANTPCSELENLEQLKILERGYRIKIALVEEPLLGVDIPQDLATLEKYLCLQSISS